MKVDTIRFKFCVLYVAIVGAILVAYSGFMYLNFYKTIYRQFDDQLNLKAQKIGDLINSYASIIGDDKQAFVHAAKIAVNFNIEHPLYSQVVELLTDLWVKDVQKFGFASDDIVILDAQKKPVAYSRDVTDQLFAVFAAAASQSRGEAFYQKVTIGKRRLGMITLPFLQGQKNEYFIQIGTSLDPVTYILQKRLFIICVGIPLILICASIVARLFIARILKPVVEISKTARDITQEKLHTRVKLSHPDEEIRYLTNSFNDMISRLETSFNYIKEFSSHVAHELKTPIAICKGEAEVALNKERSPDEYERVIQVVIEESDRMLKIIDSLLLLTKLEYRQDAFHFEKTELGTFLEDIVQEAKITASKKQVIINYAIPQVAIAVRADKVNLRRLFSNLIDNAIKFTDPGGSVTVSLKTGSHKALVVVTDTGSGIPAHELSKIFNKFYRVRRSRDIKPGYGLGLSIAQSIANIHKGQISVESELGIGTTFSVALPLI